MAKFGGFDLKGMEEFQKKLEKIQEEKVNAFIESCAKELAARLLAKVIKRTPVGDYSKKVKCVAKRNSKKHKKGTVYYKNVNPSGKKGGTLRRGWTAGSHSEAVAGGNVKNSTYIDGLKVHHFGNTYVIEISNPVEYAPYVEYGHRTANHKGWVKGKFMLTISEQEIKDITPQLLEKKMKAFLEECFR